MIDRRTLAAHHPAAAGARHHPAAAGARHHPAAAGARHHPAAFGGTPPQGGGEKAPEGGGEKALIPSFSRRGGCAAAGVVTSRLAFIAAAITLLCTPLASLADDPAGGAPAQGPLVAQAVAYEHGEGVAKDPLKAAALYCEAARAGDAEAQYGLGWMYANGRGVPHDDPIAAALFALAAAQGHAQAARMLAYVGPPSAALPECMQTKAEPEPVFAIPADWPPHKQRVATLVRELAPAYAVRPELALAVIAAESNFDPRARSAKDARGLMQLVPETAARFGVRNAYDPKENVRGGLAYLQWLLSYYRGQVRLALAAYNAGENVVDRFQGVPPYPETQGYVRRIMAALNMNHHPYDEHLTEASPVFAAAQSPRRTK
ncbi:MAG: transglycosylase SLT domain-containing protein [Burkholderiales bacterium]|nr:transglycosylase SLT domain-containing protein [Burkholderiales bacterium]